MSKENKNFVAVQGGRIDLDNFYEISLVKKNLVSLFNRIGCRSVVEGMLSKEPKKEIIYNLTPLFPPLENVIVN